MSLRRYGVIVVGVCILTLVAACGRRRAIDPPSPVSAASAIAPRILRPSAMKLEWGNVVLPKRIEAGRLVPISIDVRNAGDEEWPASDSSPVYRNGAYAVRLCHRWCGDRGVDCPPGFLSRFNLTRSLPPGERQTIHFAIDAPSRPGWYELQFDALQELVGWFSGQGLEHLRVRVKVE